MLTLFSVGRPTFWWEKLQKTMRSRSSSKMHKLSKLRLTKFTKVKIMLLFDFGLVKKTD